MILPDEIQEAVDVVKEYLPKNTSGGIYTYTPSAKERVVFALYVEMLECLAVSDDSTYNETKKQYIDKMTEVLEYAKNDT